LTEQGKDKPEEVDCKT
jgi:radial spoke head protein 3